MITWKRWPAVKNLPRGYQKIIFGVFFSVYQPPFKISLGRHEFTLRTRNFLPVAIFATCLLTYALFWSGHQYSIDGIVMFQYAKALAFQHSFQMDPPVRWGADIPVSKWPLGLTLLYLPVLAFLSVTFLAGDKWIRKAPYNPQLHHHPGLLENEAYKYSSFVNPLITAGTAVLLYALCRELGFSQKKAVLAALVFGLVSPAAAYAKYDYAQPLAALLLLMAIWFLLRSRRVGRQALLLSGFWLGLAVLARPEMALAPGLVLVGAALLRSGKPDRMASIFAGGRLLDLVVFVCPLGVFLVVNQVLNAYRFGSLLSLGYQPEFALDMRMIGLALLGNFFSPGRGLLFFFPLSLLSLPGFWLLFRKDRYAALLIGLSFLSALLLYSAWRDWPAGLSWGPRLLVPYFPYLALLAVAGIPVLKRLPRWATLGVLGLLVLLGAIAAFQGLFYNFLVYYGRQGLSEEFAWIGAQHFFFRYSPLFTGWRARGDPTWGDLYLWQAMTTQAHQALWIAVIFLGFAALAWIWYFLRTSLDWIFED
jgi:Dolichyl-phosphate-mannose-protein mannosyltransferase